MLEDMKKLNPVENKLLLKNVSEVDEIIASINTIAKLCERNGLHNTALTLAMLRLKVVYKEVEYE